MDGDDCLGVGAWYFSHGDTAYVFPPSVDGDDALVVVLAIEYASSCTCGTVGSVHGRPSAMVWSSTFGLVAELCSRTLLQNFVPELCCRTLFQNFESGGCWPVAMDGIVS